MDREVISDVKSRRQYDSMRPFDVQAKVDGEGALTIQLFQDGNEVTTFDRYSMRVDAAF